MVSVGNIDDEPCFVKDTMRYAVSVQQQRVRKWARKTWSSVIIAKHRLITKKEDGLDVVEVEGKGNGVVTTKPFKKDALLCEYRGECLSMKEARAREKEYLQVPGSGCFLYYFNFKHTKLWLVIP